MGVPGGPGGLCVCVPPAAITGAGGSGQSWGKHTHNRTGENGAVVQSRAKQKS